MLANGRTVEPEYRNSLQRHLDRLNLWLGGSDPEDIIPHVSALRSVMSRSATSESQEANAIKTYAIVLCHLPAWAIARACTDFLHGRAGDGRFAPTPAEIEIRCRVIMGRYVEERSKLERALGISATPRREPWEDDLA